jgi:nitrile hydratase subunit beta
MSRINDIGGMQGFGRLVREAEEPAFHADREAHVAALVTRDGLIGVAPV